MFVHLKKLPFDSLVPSNSGSLVLVEEEFSVFVFWDAIIYIISIGKLEISNQIW